MPRCADAGCGRWRPDLSGVNRFASTAARRLGALQLNGNWYCSRECLEQAALCGLGESDGGFRPGTPALSLRPLKLGVLLRHAGVITQPQLESALDLTARTGLRIGEQLEQLGYATPDIVLRALATQAGVSYLATFDITRVKRAPVSLPSSMVRALGLVPFESDEKARRMHVVSAAPLPRAAIRAMAKLTGWNVEPYLVTDAAFAAALDAYRPCDDAPVAHDVDMVRTLTDAAARVADQAAIDRAVTMRHAACDDYTWVRVEGSQRVSDLFVTGKEMRCQAELTAH
jgi:hypothetical protein